MSKKAAKLSETICSCFDYTVDDMSALMASEPGLRFEDLLRRTGIGSKCTACLLDLECTYSSLFTAQAKSGPNYPTQNVGAPKQKLNLKQRIYRFVDGLAPQVPIILQSPLPVLYGKGIETYLWMANNSLLFDGELCAPDFELDLTIRNANGRILDRKKTVVGRDEYFREQISEILREADPDTDFAIGSVEIIQRGKFPGVRGTRRPQIEVVTPYSAAAIHGQGPYKLAEESSFMCPNKPGDELCFVSIVSVSNAPLSLTLKFPLELSGSDELAAITRTVEVPPFGAQLIDVTLKGELAEKFTYPVQTVGWNAGELQKLHLINATNDLQRISIDHL